MDNSKETNYLQVVRTLPESAPTLTEREPQKFERATLADKMRWRGISPGTVIIAVIAYSTLLCAIAFLLTGAVLSML
jgi:hypothetical protein|tara:strand:- start:1909 stop:2139 length:231 start_codon:yes stop_codon:yes gene_type:complete